MRLGNWAQGTSRTTGLAGHELRHFSVSVPPRPTGGGTPPPHVPARPFSGRAAPKATEPRAGPAAVVSWAWT